MPVIPNNMKLKLMELCVKIGVGDEWGWQVRLAKYLNIKVSQIRGWVRGNELTPPAIKIFNQKGLPPETWYYTDNKAPPNQVNESAPLYEMPTYKTLCTTVRKILDSKDKKLIAALNMILEISLDKLEQKEQMQNLERRIQKLEAEKLSGGVSPQKSGAG